MSTNLTTAAKDLMWAKDDQDVRTRMSVLAEALDDADCEDCEESREVLLHELRTELLERAGEACAAAPNLFPPRMPHLLTLLPTLKSGKLEHLCAPPDRAQVSEITGVIRNLEACKTPDLVDAYVTAVRTTLDADPGLGTIGYPLLKKTIEEIALSDYSAALMMVLDSDWRGLYLMSLLSVLETTKHPISCLNLLCYENGYFTEVTPEALLKVEKPEQLREMLEVLRRGLPHMPPSDREDYLSGLRGIPDHVLTWLKEHLWYPRLVPEHVRCQMDLLTKLTEDGLDAVESEKPFADWSGVEAVLGARRMVHKLCGHDDVSYLESDWDDLQEYAEECPGLAWELTNYTRDELSCVILCELLNALHEENADLPPCLEMLIRLYLAADLSRCGSEGALASDEVWRWITACTEPAVTVL